MLSISQDTMDKIRQARLIALTVAAVCYTLGYRTVQLGRLAGANGRKQAVLTAVYYAVGFAIGFTRTIISAYSPTVNAKVRLYAPKVRTAAAKAASATIEAAGRFYNTQLGESTLLPRYTPASVRAYRSDRYRAMLLTIRNGRYA